MHRVGMVPSRPFTQPRLDLPRVRAPQTGLLESLTSGGIESKRKPEPYPTVLVAAGDDAVRQALVESLRRERYHVLEAKSAAEALDVVRSHSRPIQIVLVDINMHDSAITVVLNRFRPHMHILPVTKGSTVCRTGALALDAALAKARELFQDDGVRVAGTF